jgi:hypothetical protein
MNRRPNVGVAVVASLSIPSSQFVQLRRSGPEVRRGGRVAVDPVFTPWSPTLDSLGREGPAGGRDRSGYTQHIEVG